MLLIIALLYSFNKPDKTLIKSEYDVLLTSVYDHNNGTNHNLEVNSVTLKNSEPNLTNLVERNKTKSK